MAAHPDPVIASAVHLAVLPGKRPITPKQVVARRENGKKSQGPKTTAGKAVSRLNGLRHGFFSDILPDVPHVVLGSRADYEDQIKVLTKDFSPRSSFARTIVGTIAMDQIRLRRVMRMEVAILRKLDGRFHPTDDTEIANARACAAEYLGCRYEDVVRIRDGLREAVGTIAAGKHVKVSRDSLEVVTEQLWRGFDSYRIDAERTQKEIEKLESEFKESLWSG